MAAASPATAQAQRPPRVFLSYSHDSPEHAARVLALAKLLRRDGVNARIDQFDAFPPEGWPQWCAREILDARYVLLVCTKTYRRRFFGYEKAGVGRGVKWEGKILQNILYNDERNLRFTPVVFAKADERFIPETVQDATRVLVSDCKRSDAGYKSLLRHFTGGKKLRPLPKISRIAEPLRSPDASVPTEQVWEEVTTLVIQKLDEIQAEQKDHERKSVERHQEVLAVVTDPVVLRARLEEKIAESFEQKRAELLGEKAPPAEIDALYRWRDRATAQLTEAVAFITARAADPNSPIIKKAAAILEERGVDATLEFLDATLKAERQRRKEEGRQLAEASLMKAGLHESRLETEEQQRAIRDAIDDAPDWWRPHHELGVILYRRAQWQLAEQEYEAARKAMPAAAETTVLNNLALLYQDTNRLAEAEPLMERVLKLDEKSHGPEHPKVTTSLNNLAQLYKATNRLAEAEPLMERALKIDEKSFGPEHPNVAIRLNNLARLYHDTNRLAEAEPLMERALKIDEKSFGPEHPEVAPCLNNLATLYLATNRLAEAEPLMERALKIDEKSFGPEHPSVARDVNNLAQLYQATNRRTEAEPLMERALEINEKSYGPEHPQVAASLGNLAALYKATNRLPKAEPLMERALKIDEKSFGPEHPNVALRLNNLALLYEATNRVTEAESLMERALKIDEKSYGPEHPEVATRLGNLAQLYEATNRVAEAELLMERALKITEKSFGPEHPDVALHLNNLGQLYRATNRVAEAEPLMERAAVILLRSTRASGHPLPNLKAALNNFAGLLETMSLSTAEVIRRLAEAGSEAGYTWEEFGEVIRQLGE